MKILIKKPITLDKIIINMLKLKYFYLPYVYINAVYKNWVICVFLNILFT